MTGAQVDPEVVRERLQHILRAVDTLREYQQLSFEQFASTPKNYWAVEHGLQLCVQGVIDIATHLVAALGGRIGHEYRDQVRQLGEVGVLPGDVSERLAPMVGFRNILVHEYLEVDLQEVHRVLTHHLGDFLSFAAHVEDFLQRLERRSDPPPV